MKSSYIKIATEGGPESFASQIGTSGAPSNPVLQGGIFSDFFATGDVFADGQHQISDAGNFYIVYFSVG
ncbi:hypothetical protein IVZ55_27900 [Salmonella enterica subsp. enterica serovar Worthington]|nr:hypothetical protein [Salmonella enterica subsp. enterica serovar Worthington]